MFIVIELQTDAAGNTSNISQSYDNYSDAESRFHQILSTAAISNVPVHSACILDERGQLQRTEYYIHEDSLQETDEQ